MANTIPVSRLQAVLGIIQSRVYSLTGQSIQTLPVKLAQNYDEGTEREKAEIITQLVDGLRMLDSDHARAVKRKAAIGLISARLREKIPGVLLTQLADPYVDAWLEMDDAQRDVMIDGLARQISWPYTEEALADASAMVVISESEPEERLDAAIREAIAEGTRSFYLASYSIELDNDEVEGITRSIEYAWQRRGAQR